MENNLQSDIVSLTPIQMKEIYKILELQQEPYTQNNNGIFFNTKCVKETTLELMNKTIIYFIPINSKIPVFLLQQQLLESVSPIKYMNNATNIRINPICNDLSLSIETYKVIN